MILTDSNELDAVLALMRRAASVAICGHTSPDGDALGMRGDDANRRAQGRVARS